MDAQLKIYLLRALLAVLGGLVSGLMKWSLPTLGLAIIVMGMVYLFTIMVVYRYTVSRGILSLKTIFLEGIGTFILLWLFVWAVVYNILVIY